MIYVVYFSNAGAPATGLSPTIATYKKVSDGGDVSGPPVVSEIGGGFYKFTAAPTEALVIRVDSGVGLADADRYKVMQITPNDADLDTAVSSRGAQTDMAAIKAKTDNLPASPANEANVETHVAAALAAYHPPTKSEMDAALAALNDITVGDLLAGDLSDSVSFPANSLAGVVRQLFWVLCNRLVINHATGAFTAYKNDGVTPGVTGTITDDEAATERSDPAWA